MNSTMVRILALALLLVAFFVFSFTDTSLLSANVFDASGCEVGHLCVHFLDVGQGDATFIESPSGTQVLIDGGPDSGVLRALGKHMSFFDSSIDMVIATHPDKDHIGGLIDVLERYRIGTIMVTRNKSETTAAKVFNTSRTQEGASLVYARTGQRIDIGGGAYFDILFPDRDASEFESNASSIIVRLVYDETEFLFTGDAPQAVEEYLVSFHDGSLASDVLKVGHHGSKTATAETFVSAVDPEYAVISAGRDNRYGHPHEEILERLRAHSIETKNTAESGSITFVSDGETLEFK